MVIRLLRYFKIYVIVALFWIALLLLAVLHSCNVPSQTKSHPRNIPEKLQQQQQQREPNINTLRQLLYANSDRNWALNETCAPYPQYNDIHFVNQHLYQRVKGGNFTYHLFSAFYDRRNEVTKSPRIVILAMVSTVLPPYPPTFCQVWHKDNGRPRLAKVVQHSVPWYSTWGNVPGFSYPTLISCEMPEEPAQYRVPQLVSLVFDTPCERATNALEIVYSAPQRSLQPRFAVCVKDLRFDMEDRSARFVEWLELLRLLGAEKVTAYTGPLHPNATRTLKHYMDRNDLFEMRQFELLVPHGRTPKDQLVKNLNEVLVYNDCFYRNLYEFDYVGVFDVDEVIMPLGEDLRNWTALLHRFEAMGNFENKDNCNRWGSYCFRNVYFPRRSYKPPHYPDFPEHFYMLQHVERVHEHSDPNSAIKCLHSTALVKSVHNHFPLDWANCCASQDVPTNLGQMQHYREPDNEALAVAPGVIDSNIWRFKDELVERCNAKFRELQWTQ